MNKNILLALLIFFSLHVSSQEWALHGNGHIKNTNSGHVAIGGGNALDFVNLAVGSSTTLASQIPSHGWWNLYSSVRTTHTGSASKLWGAYFLARLGGSGNLAEMTGINVETGTDNNSGGTITDAFGLKVRVYKNDGNITNGYGVYIKDIEAANQYALFQDGTDDINYFAGNVGIGTTTPDSKLSVNGIIHSKKVKVDLVGWSDFVFENTYNLPTLEEVEKHIQENGHLQDIPSAQEVKENGIYLGDMDAKLLQKIEELTLYTIEQEKKLKEQEEESRLQKKEIDEIKKQLNQLIKKNNS